MRLRAAFPWRPLSFHSSRSREALHRLITRPGSGPVTPQAVPALGELPDVFCGDCLIERDQRPPRELAEEPFGMAVQFTCEPVFPNSRNCGGHPVWYGSDSTVEATAVKCQIGLILPIFASEVLGVFYSLSGLVLRGLPGPGRILDLMIAISPSESISTNDSVSPVPVLIFTPTPALLASLWTVRCAISN